MARRNPSIVTNGGSAIGEAIGVILEEQVHRVFRSIEHETNCFLITKMGDLPTRDGKKLRIKDQLGNEYDVDGLMVDDRFYPLILIESKYIRYTKHNRDKASWICNAHGALRKTYPSIRASIAVLAGNWSAPSLAMLSNNNVSYYLIPFQRIAEILARYGIDFLWEEKDSAKALAAWTEYSRLNDRQRAQIGIDMISIIEERLRNHILDVLDDTVEREVETIVIELHTTKGETFTYSFDSVEDACEFLEDFEGEFDESQFVSILQM